MREAATQDFGGAGGSATNQRALVACAAQIVAENAVRKGSGTGDKSSGPGVEEVIIPRKENANLKNIMYNQFKGKVDTLMAATPGVRDQQFKQPYGGAMRQQYLLGLGEEGVDRGARIEEDTTATPGDQTAEEIVSG